MTQKKRTKENIRYVSFATLLAPLRLAKELAAGKPPPQTAFALVAAGSCAPFTLRALGGARLYQASTDALKRIIDTANK